MSPLAIGWICFACVFGGALLGMLLRGVLPDDHLMNQDSKEVVRLGMGLVGTMAALVLGLLIASAKSSFDTQSNEIRQGAANIVLLDRALAQYGAETKDAREALRRAIALRLETTWPEESSRTSRVETPETTPTVEGIETGVRELQAKTDGQRWLQSRALQIIGDLQQTRWLLFGGAGDSIPTPFLVVLVFWIAVIFASFGLYAPPNATIVGILLLCALSVAASVFLVLELSQPFGGLLKISAAPLRYALSHLGQ
jgi:hypothetical protein